MWLAVGQPVVLPERSLEILESVRQVFHRETLAPACPVFSGGQEGLDDSVLTENCHGTGDLVELRERFRVFRRELSGIHFGTRYNPCPVDVWKYFSAPLDSNYRFPEMHGVFNRRSC